MSADTADTADRELKAKHRTMWALGDGAADGAMTWEYLLVTATRS